MQTGYPSQSDLKLLPWSILPHTPRYSFGRRAIAVEDEPGSGAQGLTFYYTIVSRLLLSEKYTMCARSFAM